MRSCFTPYLCLAGLLIRSATAAETPAPAISAETLAALARQVRAFTPDDLFAVTQRAQAGDAPAAYQMGLAYKLGAGAARDAAEALKWFKVSAGKNFAPAEEEVFLAYATGSGTAKDPAEGLRWLTRAAEHGLPSAQFGLGLSFEQAGQSAAAVPWYRRAAEQGSASAENALGFAYEKGRGVEADPATAATWYRRAAEHGSANAQSNLGSLLNAGTGVPKDSGEAAQWFRRSAEQGWAAGMLNLAGLHVNGTGVPKDWIAAYRWGRLGAQFAPDQATRDQGNLLVSLLEKRMKPEEVEAARKQAEAWAAEFNRRHRTTAGGGALVVSPAPAAPGPEYLRQKQAAEAGDAKAQVDVGAYHYRRGEHEEALRWFTRAAEQQDSRGEYSLGVLHLEGSGTPKDEATARRWFEQAAARWNLDAMNNLVALHYRQRQTGDHLVQAYVWTSLAASAGHKVSQNNLAPIKAELNADQLASAEQAAAAWLKAHPRP